MRGSFRAFIPSEVGKEKANDKNDAVLFVDRRSLRLSPLKSKATSLSAREAFQTIFPLKRERYAGLRLRDMFTMRTRYAPKAQEGAHPSTSAPRWEERLRPFPSASP